MDPQFGVKATVDEEFVEPLGGAITLFPSARDDVYPKGRFPPFGAGLDHVGHRHQKAVRLLGLLPPNVDDAPFRRALGGAAPLVDQHDIFAHFMKVLQDADERFAVLLLLVESQNDGVGGQGADAVGGRQALDAAEEIRNDVDFHQGRNPFCGQETPDGFFHVFQPRGLEFLLGQKDRDRQEPGAVRDGVGEIDQVPAGCRRAAEYQKVWTPGTRVFPVPVEGINALPGKEKKDGTPKVRPAGRDVSPHHQEVDEDGEEKGDESGAGVDHEHGAQAGGGSREGKIPGVPEGGSPGGVPDESFKPRGQVQKAVGRQEEHGKHRADDVQAPQGDPDRGDQNSEGGGQTRAFGLSIRPA